MSRKLTLRQNKDIDLTGLADGKVLEFDGTAQKWMPKSKGTPGPHATTHEAGGDDEISVEGLPGLLYDPQTPVGHHLTHEQGAADQMNVAGLPGELADQQKPKTHSSTHESGGSDEMSVDGLPGLLYDPQVPVGHHLTHEQGAADEMNVANLSGELADKQKPKPHVAEHESGGIDEMSVDGLSGLLYDPQTPLPHKTTHAKTAADEIKVESLGTAGAINKVPKSDGTGGMAMGSVDHTELTGVSANQHHNQLHEASHVSGGGDAFLSTDLLEAIVKRLRESGGPTDLLVGAIPDGFVLVRSGSGIIGAAHRLRQTTSANISVDTSITSTTFADLLSLSITTTAGGILLARFAGGFGQSANNGQGRFRLQIDGVTQNASGFTQLGTSAAGSIPNPLALNCRLAVSAGAHTVKVQWACGSAGNTVSCKPVTYPDYNGASLVVEEVGA